MSLPQIDLKNLHLHQIEYSLVLIFIVMLLSACGGGGSEGSGGGSISGGLGSSSTSDLTSSGDLSDDEEVSVFGAGVKGPLTDSSVTAYVLDLDKPDLKGGIVARGHTDSLAQLQMRIKKRHLSKGPFLLEYQGGFELNGSNPIIDRLYTVMTEERIRQELPVYATPLTSLVVNLAQESLVGNAGKEDFAIALDTAEVTVKKAFWLGDQSDLDIFETSPVLNRTESPGLTFMLRRASELFAASVGAISDELARAGIPYEGNAIVSFLAEDLNDGVIDGFNRSLVVSELAGIDNLNAILTIDPDLLMIPGTDSEIAELDTFLLEEAEVLQKIVSSQTEEALVEAAVDETAQIRFNNRFVDNPDSNSGRDGFGGEEPAKADVTDSVPGDNALTIELKPNSVNPVWTVGTQKIVEMRVSKSFVDQIDCYLDVVDGNQTIIGTSPELWSPYRFKLSKVGSVPAGEYAVHIRCYAKGDSSVVLASTSTSLTVINEKSGTSTSSAGTADSGTTDSDIIDSGTTDGSDATDSSGTTDDSLSIKLASGSLNPIWTAGDQKLVKIVVSESYIDQIDCYLDVVDGNQTIMGTSPELWSPYLFKLSKVGSVPAGEYSADIRCYAKGDTDVVLASTSTSLTVIKEESQTSTTDLDTADNGTGDSDTADSGATDSGTVDGSDTNSTSLTIELTGDSANPIWTVGTEKIVEMQVSNSYIDQIDCYLDVMNGNQRTMGTSPELWSPYRFKLSKVGSVPSGDYTMDIRCYAKGDTDVVLASTSTSLTVIDDTSDTGNGDSSSDGPGTGNAGLGDSGSSDSGANEPGSNDSDSSDSGSDGTSDTPPVAADIEFSWVWPTTREDGTALDSDDIDSFEVYYYRTGRAGVRVNVNARDSSNALVNQYVVQNLEVGSYEFAVAAVDTEGNVSAFTTPILIAVE